MLDILFFLIDMGDENMKEFGERFERAAKGARELMKPGKGNLLEMILKAENNIGKKVKEYVKTLWDASIVKTLYC